MQSEKKQKLLMMAGPIHLFWTTGSFYLYELSETYCIRLIVSEAYKESSQFHQLCDELSIGVDYLPEGNIFIRNFNFAVRLRQIVKDFAPDFLLIHNRFYPESLYLLHWCRVLVPNCFRLSYQDGRVAFDWGADFRARLACDVGRLSSSFPLLPIWFLEKIKKVHYRMLYWIHIKMLPYIFVGKTFRPLLDVYSGREFKLTASVNFEYEKDFMLVYLRSEAEIMEKHYCKGIVLVTHPISRGMLTHPLRDTSSLQPAEILVLPSYGIIDSLLCRDDAKHIDVVKKYSESWVSALTRILLKFPDRKIGIKLHPSSIEDKVWEKVLCNIKNAIPEILVYPSSVVAESLILQSEIVVGDTSTAIWWASLCGDKIAISLDLFDYEGSKEMRNYEGIKYITAVEQIDDLESYQYSNGCHLHKMTVSKFISNLCS